MRQGWLSALVIGLASFQLNCSGCDTEAYVVSNPPLLVSGTDLLDFGKIPVDYIASRTIQLANAGQQELVFENIEISEGGDVFTITPGETSILGGQSMDLIVSFKPLEAKVYEGTLTILSNSQDKSETTISLTGEGDEDVVCEDCNNPPEDTCLDENTLMIYVEDGECVEGICRYEPSTVFCPYGCEDGACLPQGDAGVVPESDPVMDAGVSDEILDGHFSMLSMALGQAGSCALLWQDEDKQVACWGYHGILGQGPDVTTDSNVPLVIPNFTDVKYLAAGSYHMCASKIDNTLWCWGINNYGELGNGSNITDYTPQLVSVIEDPVEMFTAGRNFTCAVTRADETDAEQKVYCWGQGDWGQLGNGSFDNSTTAEQVTGLPEGVSLISIEAGEYHVCAMLESNQVYCWGWNGHNQCLVSDNTQNQATPVEVYEEDDNNPMQQLALGMHHSCVIEKDDKVKCWGGNGYGQVDADSNVAQYAQIMSPAGLEDDPVLGIASGSYHSCAIMMDRTISCWGHNSSGACGSGEANVQEKQSLMPIVAPANDTQWYRVYGGSSHTCAADSEHQVFCWGSNGYGQLGAGSTEMNQYVPVPVSW
ncbi:MAG: hypothetical protein CMH56_01100 [Myxococcales bacterium]|nr:hypothetical protein [Myxococcales bacterium]